MSKPGLVRRLHIDPVLLALVFVLSVVGLLGMYSASGADTALMYRQGLRLMIAWLALLLFAQCSPLALARAAIWFYVLSIVLLLSVLFLGDESRGARRWLDLAWFRFQPSELVKFSIPLMLASYYANSVLPPRLPQLGMACVLLFLPTAMIVRQPDLGTALLVMAGGVAMIFAAGVRWRHLLFLTAVVLVYAPLHWHFVMHDYQRARVLTFLNPGADPLGAGYHIIQSQIAIGSGGAAGKGWLHGTQSHLEFLPERSTDFVFAVFCEEFGFLGAVLLLCLYLCIVLRGLHIAFHAQDTFSRLLACGLVTIFVGYVTVNIGMASGVLPVVGVPLPLVSLGGSAMVTVMVSLGILMSIQTQTPRQFLHA